MNLHQDYAGRPRRMSDPESLESPEARLELNREALRERLIEAEERQGPVARATHLAAPVMRQVVREHPYTSLAAAALAGVWLARQRPWRVLGSSLMAGLIARQVMALSLWSGNRLLDRLSTYKQAPGRPPQP